MADQTKIEWADATWNPVTGCSPISEGCANCYALRLLKGRLRGRYGVDAENPCRPTLHDGRLLPVPAGRGKLVFICSMSDLFHTDVPWIWINKVWTIAHTFQQHTYIILTKRPARMAEFFRDRHHSWDAMDGPDVPPPNIWLGVSVENQQRADERIPILLDIPAAKHIVSYEPAMGPVDFGPYLNDCFPREHDFDDSPVGYVPCNRCGGFAPIGQQNHGIDWLICGAETGPGARPMDLDWARTARDACVEAGVPFCFKRDSTGSRLLDGREWNERPAP